MTTDVPTLLRARDRLLEEAFGPLSVVVNTDPETDVAGVLRELFPGNLTGTVHLGAGEQSPPVLAILRQLAGSCGRVLVDGWPTGVAVTPAMQHGGPFPATTDGASTSVGTEAVRRLLRPVCYQDVPEQLLPPPLQTANPWGVPQRLALPGESTSWGHAARAAAG